MPGKKQIRTIAGKTITKAEFCADAYSGCSNFCISLQFTDGTEFSLDVKNYLQAEGVMYRTDNDRKPRKVLKW